MKIIENIDLLAESVKDRKEDSHKGDFGHALIIAGSEGMLGAAMLCTKAALLSGAGLVSLSIEKGLFPVIQQSIWEAMTVDRDSTLDRMEKYSVLGIGPGLSTKGNNRRLILGILNTYEGPLVIDADGLNIISEHDLRGELKAYGGGKVLTPHPKEAERLLGISSEEYITMGREKVAMELARLSETTVVLKGHNTIVTDGRERYYINRTGNPGMATAGSGDVLTGVITGLISTGIPTFEAACLGVYVHGLSGDMAAKKKGMRSLMATDILDDLPTGFIMIEKEKVR